MPRVQITLFLIITLLFPFNLFFPEKVFASSGEKFSNTSFETDLSGWSRGDGDWWLSGGVNASNVIAIYQPQYAATYADSKINLANNGTYDAHGGVAPTWNKSTGWYFNGTTQYLSTDINSSVTRRVGARKASTLVKFSDSIQHADWFVTLLGGSFYDDEWDEDAFVLQNQGPASAPEYKAWTNLDDYNSSGPTNYTEGVFGFSGIDVYYNGSAINQMDEYWPTSDGTFPDICIGAECATYKTGDPWAGQLYEGNIQVITIYDSELTADQVSAITTAMNNLTGNSSHTNASVSYVGNGSAKVVANTNFNFIQSVNVGDDKTYYLSAYAYTDGTAVTSSDAEFYYNGSAVSTTYSSAGNGWYRMTATVKGADSSRDYGVQVKAGKYVYLDNISLSQAYQEFESSSSGSSYDLEIGDIADIDMGDISEEVDPVVNNSENKIKVVLTKRNRPALSFNMIDEDDEEVDMEKYDIQLQYIDELGRREDTWRTWARGIKHKDPEKSTTEYIDGFKIKYSGGSSNKVEIQPITKELKSGKYYMRIKAYDKEGNSVKSKKIELVVD